MSERNGGVPEVAGRGGALNLPIVGTVFDGRPYRSGMVVDDSGGALREDFFAER